MLSTSLCEEKIKKGSYVGISLAKYQFYLT